MHTHIFINEDIKKFEFISFIDESDSSCYFEYFMFLSFKDAAEAVDEQFQHTLQYTEAYYLHELIQ